MRFARRLSTLFVCAATLALGLPAGAAAAECAGADLAPAADNTAQVAAATLCLVNEERARTGRSRLVRQGQLDAAAERHARDMVARRYFSHEAPSGTHSVDRIRAAGYLGTATEWIVGENLAWGTGIQATPRRIVVAWMASPGHRANILKARYREMGLSVVLGNPSGAGDGGATYATTFGTRTAAGKRGRGRAARGAAARKRSHAARHAAARHSSVRGA